MALRAHLDEAPQGENHEFEDLLKEVFSFDGEILKNLPLTNPKQGVEKLSAFEKTMDTRDFSLQNRRSVLRDIDNYRGKLQTLNAAHQENPAAVTSEAVNGIDELFEKLSSCREKVLARIQRGQELERKGDEINNILLSDVSRLVLGDFQKLETRKQSIVVWEIRRFVHFASRISGDNRGDLMKKEAESLRKQFSDEQLQEERKLIEDFSNASSKFAAKQEEFRLMNWLATLYDAFAKMLKIG